MSQRTILLLGGSMSGIRIPATDVRDGRLVVPVPDPTAARFMRENSGAVVPSVGFHTEQYKRVRFGLIETELMVLEELSPDRALGQYLRGEPVR